MTMFKAKIQEILATFLKMSECISMPPLSGLVLNTNQLFVDL
jgi:hypothetical protein